MRGLSNKVIVVTGGNGLLGRSMVGRLLDEGSRVINVDIDHETDLASGKFKADLTKDSEVDQLVSSVVKAYGRIDGLVNNAYPRTQDWGNKWEDIVADSWRKNVDMQLNSVFYITQAIGKQMKLQGNGTIVNIASIYGVVGNDFTVYDGTGMTSPAAYAAIKGGVINLTRYLASYMGKDGIRVNCVSPGGIFNHQHEVFVSNYQKKVPMGRMGLPDDISPAVAFLLSEDSGYISGQNLIVDGGWTAI
jgi:NAD(P)-dependent dehydrogenase (short-subunit alcohol dehydrogenase family)